MKLLGHVIDPGSGEISWSEDGSPLVRSVHGSTRGELLANMRSTAHQIWVEICNRKARDMGPLNFEIVEDAEAEPTSKNEGPDPGLVDLARLQARRAAGEHLCFFCLHEQICAIQTPLRAHPQALVVISGCAKFTQVASK